MASRTRSAVALTWIVGFIAVASTAAAQSQPSPYNASGGMPAGPAGPNYSASPGGSGLRQPLPQSPGMQPTAGQPLRQIQPMNSAGTQPAMNPGMVQIQAGPLPVPFALSPQQQAELDKLLTEWEAASSKVDLFKCDVSRLEYDPTFGGPGGLRASSKGELKYKAPDKGLFHITEASNWLQDPKTGKWQPTKIEPQEFWTCDGKSTFQVVKQGEGKTEEKLILETPIPAEMQGKSITEGPLPFVFGAKAEALKKRYYLRIITPPSEVGTHIWLEAFPKTQKDASNFAWVELILTKDTKLPVAIQIYSPGCDPKADHNQQSRTMIALNNPSVNSPWGEFQQMLGDFSRPNLIGYRHVLQSEATPPTAPQAPGGGSAGTPQMTGGSTTGNDQANRLRQPQR